MPKIRVFLVDDQTIIRDGLKSLIQSNTEFTVVGEAENGQVACEKVASCQPDVILMDIRMPFMNGVEATRCIKEKHKDMKIIILTTFDDDQFIIEAMKYGASGYLLKDIQSDQLFKAMKDSLKGDIILPGQIALKIISHLSIKKQTVDLSEFSSREMDIIRLLVAGKTNLEIADTLYLSTGTVKNYISQIYAKIDCTDRTQAVLYFKEQGL